MLNNVLYSVLLLLSKITKRRSYATLLSIVMFNKTLESSIESDWNVKQEKFPYQPKEK